MKHEASLRSSQSNIVSWYNTLTVPVDSALLAVLVDSVDSVVFVSGKGRSQ